MIPKFRYWDGQDKVIGLARDISFCENDEIILYIDGDEWSLGPDLVLMQSTGLKDKNGVEIYEGDIIGSENKDRENWYVSHHKVVWHDTGFKGKQICSRSFIGLAHWTRGEKGYVVIGNIYENPELLEVSK